MESSQLHRKVLNIIALFRVTLRDVHEQMGFGSRSWELTFPMTATLPSVTSPLMMQHFFVTQIRMTAVTGVTPKVDILENDTFPMAASFLP